MLTMITEIGDVVYELIKLSKERMDRLGLHLFSNQGIMFISRLKVYTSGHRNANTFAINDSVLIRLFVRLELTLTNYCCLKDVDYIKCFIVTCYLMLLLRRHCDPIRQRLRATTKSMQLILFLMLRLITSQEGGVLTCSS
jgi:hypothetical protein